MESPKGIELAETTAWLAAHLQDMPPPYEFELIAAGGSNLTYRVTAANNARFILRRPPVRARLATAHDMQREYKIIGGLQGSAVPVPQLYAWCDDAAVTGSEFYCMELVEGLALREQADCAAMTAADCWQAMESLVAAQVAFHQIDLEAVGLADLAQHDGYLQRQLKRWKRQVEVASQREQPLFEELHATLAASAPASELRPGLAHGDYRFDNCILDPDYRVAAVLDWELCTIGDPRADFIWSLNYWAEPGESLTWLLSPPTQHPEFVGRQQVLDCYCEMSGVSMTHMQWYNAFSWWKQACIVEGVLARLQQGASGGMKVQSVDAIRDRIDAYLRHARELLA